jgi:hypothetical protein
MKKVHAVIASAIIMAASAIQTSPAVGADSVSKTETSRVSVQIPTGAEYRCPQWEELMEKHGLPKEVFSYIAWRESRCTPKAIGWNYVAGAGHWSCKRQPAPQYKKCWAVKSYDSGLFQINSTWVTVTADVCKTKWGDMSVLLNPTCNAKVAAFLYKRAGGLLNWGFANKGKG